MHVRSAVRIFSLVRHNIFSWVQLQHFNCPNINAETNLLGAYLSYFWARVASLSQTAIYILIHTQEQFRIPIQYLAGEEVGEHVNSTQKDPGIESFLL